jgi:hypothetical protein
MISEIFVGTLRRRLRLIFRFLRLRFVCFLYYLMVTHNTELTKYANAVYAMADGVVKSM